VYDEESFAADSPFKRRIEGEASMVCESARRSLLGQGYLIESSTGEEIRARKAASGASQNTFIEMNIVCLPESSGTTLFATGLLSEYALKKSTSAASVGVSALGSISLPIGQSADSLVKVSEETIENKGYYQRFFAAVSAILAEMQAAQLAAEKAAPATGQFESPTQAAAPTEPVVNPPATVAGEATTEATVITGPEPASRATAETLEPVVLDDIPDRKTSPVENESVNTAPGQTMEHILAREFAVPAALQPPAADASPATLSPVTATATSAPAESAPATDISDTAEPASRPTPATAPPAVDPAQELF